MKQNWFEKSDHTELLASREWSECEDRICAFEKAWRQALAPDIDSYLCASGLARLALLTELAHLDLEFRFASGQSARVETYLERYPELSADRYAAMELIEAEHRLRQHGHQNVSWEDYRKRFPNYVDELIERAGGIRKGASTPVEQRTTGAALNWPTVLGYEIVAEIARGGMGVVYKAFEPSLGRHVALKFLPTEVVHDPARLERFLHEARTASALNHPHICTVHALGKHGERPFIVLEFIEGETLRAQITRRPGVDKAARWIAQAAQALAAAHAAGVVHRDIKPENIMVRGDGYVKVLDFGLARRHPSLPQSGAGHLDDTDPGTFLGTVAYMSPEQAFGATTTSASDIFSLGLVLYQLVTGQHPFQAESAFGMLQAIATGQPVPPSRLCPEIPVAVDGLIEAMLHKEPQLRPAAVEVNRLLSAFATAATHSTASPPPQRFIVHRERELAALHSALQRADTGRGEVVCVAGEPGIGKSALVQGFLESPAVANRHCLVARGRCSERLGSAEAYMPVVDGLHDLLRTQTSDGVGRLIRVIAPDWYFQLAHIVGADLPAPDASEVSRASSQPALLREFRALVEEMSRLAPVIVFLDDVHWADVATVDLLTYLGRHCQALRLLLIVTYRPTELLLGPHPFHSAKLELQSHGGCSELPLDFLGSEDIARYLALAFPEHAFPADFANLIHARTEGNPLFMVELLRDLREHRVIKERDGSWSLERPLSELLQELPSSIRSMIQRKLERLGDADRRLLAAASVQGVEFDSLAVADALQLDPADVDDRLQWLDRVHGLVRAIREHEFPDRTLTLRYAFVHVLYQQALYDDLPATRRAALSAALAGALEIHHGSENLTVSAELACLYEVGRDFARAARHFWLSARNAARVFAHREAIVLARRGLDQVASLPETAQRTTLELALQTTLGLQLQVTEGYAAAEAKEAYSRARALCQSDTAPESLFPVLWGLWVISKVRSELPQAQEMADELLQLAHRLNDPTFALQAHQALGMTAFCRGQPAVAVGHVEQATSLYDPGRHVDNAFQFGQDPAIISKAYGAVAFWLLGYPDRARQQSAAAVRASRSLSPSSQAVALHFAAMLHQSLKDGRRVCEHTAAAGAIAAEHGFSFWLAGAGVLGGWGLAACGQIEDGVRQLRQGLVDWSATGSLTYQTYYLGLLAEVLRAQGERDAAARALDEALALVEQTDERLYEAELYRLRGELGMEDARSREAVRRADDDFHRAFEVARRQEAKTLQLRTATSMALRQVPSSSESRDLLASTLGWFNEGFDTPDLKDAKELLEQLA